MWWGWCAWWGWWGCGRRPTFEPWPPSIAVEGSSERLRRQTTQPCRRSTPSSHSQPRPSDSRRLKTVHTGAALVPALVALLALLALVALVALVVALVALVALGVGAEPASLLLRVVSMAVGAERSSVLLLLLLLLLLLVWGWATP